MVAFMLGKNPKASKIVALVFSAIPLVAIRAAADSSSALTVGTFQYVENFTWIEPLGISYTVGVDGISIAHGLPDHAAVLPGHPVLLGRGRADQPVHGPDARAGGRRPGRVHVPGLLPVLRLLGGRADPDVLPHSDMGRSEAGLRVDQVLHLHPHRVAGDAAGYLRPVLRGRAVTWVLRPSTWRPSPSVSG